MSKKHFTMTVNQLHRILGNIIAEGNGRCKVCVNKDTFTHNLEGDGCVILDVDACRVESVMQMNGDGGILHGPDDRERYKTCCVLFGDSDEGPQEGLAALTAGQKEPTT